MMNRMIVGNLVHRPIRSLISIVAVALEVTLILLIVGLCVGMLQDSRTRTAGIGADVLVRPPGSSFISAFSGAPMPIKVVTTGTCNSLENSRSACAALPLMTPPPA